MATQAEWTKRVQRWNKSGQSAEEFAAREGLKKERLVWWRWKLRAEAAASKDAAPLSFLPVQVVEPKASPVLRSALMDIVLPNGRVVRVAPGFDLAALAHVLLIAEQEQDQGRAC
jgi:transposase